MANRFLNNITINDEYTLPSADGTADQIITTDGAGQLSFVDQSTIASGSAEVVEVPVKNVSGSGLTKGDPVYISGSVGASGILEVQLADAGNSAKMPAVGLLKQDLANNGEGFAVITGKLRNLVTSPIDGVTPSEGDVVYVKSGGSTGAALTTTKPTGASNLIQNMGKVGRVSTAADGTYVVSSILRSNDVPNLSTGKIWVGDGNTTESTVVHLDETNGRMGIGTSTPGYKLDVNGSIRSGGNYLGSSSAYTYLSLANGNTHHKFYTKTNTTAASERFTIEGGAATTNAYFSNVNVGIGTTSPSRKLQVIGTDGAAKFYYNSSFTNAQYSVVDVGMMTSGTAADGFGPKITFRMGGNGYDGYATGNIGTVRNGADNTHNLTFGTSNAGSMTTKMVITNTGNVGIGTTSPGQRLHVNSSVTNHVAVFESTDSIAEITIQDNSKYTRLLNVSTDFKIMPNDGADEFVFEGDTGNLLVPGKVGIGTTSPARNLHVVGSGTTVATKVEATDGSQTSLDLENTEGWFRLINDGGALYVYDQADSAERFRINTSGNVGIGTSSPSEKLEVAGKIKMSENSSFPVTIKNLNSSANAIETNVALDIVAGGNYGINFKDGSTTNLAINGYSGFVGIGPTTPSTKLHVGVGSGSSSTTQEFRLQTQSGGYGGEAIVNLRTGQYGTSGIYFGDGLSHTSQPAYLKFVDSSNSLQLKTTGTFTCQINSSIEMSLSATGLGVGTTSPGEKLEVNGSVKATATTDAYKGYIKQAYACTPLMKTASSAYNFVPFNSTIFVSTADYYNRMVTPYEGRVKKVILKHTGGSTPTATNVNFKKHINDVTSSTIYTGSVTDAASDGMQAEYNFNNSDFTFNDGDTIGVLIQGTGIGTTKTLGGMSVQIIVEYNIT